MILTLLGCWLLSLPVMAQDSAAAKPVEMAGKFRADGKIYVVITVLLIILLGLFLYVFRLDRKINRLEKDLK
jgi:CcmD family protein